MRWLILILFLVSFAATSQERSVTLPSLNASQTYYKYTGQTADVLVPTTRDTIQYTIYLNKEYPIQYYINLNLEPTAGADTTVIVNLYGKVFSGETWSRVSNSTTGAITAETDYPLSSFAGTETMTSTLVFNADSTITGLFTSANVASYYRYFMLELIITDDDSVGTGIDVNNIEFKIWRREF